MKEIFLNFNNTKRMNSKKLTKSDPGKDTIFWKCIQITVIAQKS